MPCPAVSEQAAQQRWCQVNQRGVCLSEACGGSKRVSFVRGSVGALSCSSPAPEKAFGKLSLGYGGDGSLHLRPR